MMKKLHLSLLMLLIGVWAMASDTSVKNADGVEIWYDFNSNTKTASVTYKGESRYTYEDEYIGNVVIPSKVTYKGEEYSVTKIGDDAFFSCRPTSITIPESVTEIGCGVFAGCIDLTSIEVASGNENYIAVDGVLYNKNKTSLIQYPAGKDAVSYNIPESVTSIGERAFEDCSGLTSVTIPESVTSIGSLAFLYCNKLYEVYNKSDLTITAGSSDNGDVAYYAKNVYTDSEGASKLKTEGDYIFYVDGDNIELLAYTGDEKSIILPSDYEGKVYKIANYAFYGCSGLTSVTIPEGVMSIGDYAFYNCSGLTSVTIPEGVTSIGDYAFKGCSGLTSVTIPEGVTEIEGSAFSGCSGLTSVTIPEGVTSIGESAFAYCSSLTSVTIPEGVTEIGRGAFYYCSGLRSVTIPESVTSIGVDVFDGCSGLARIDVASNNDYYTSVDGVLFNKDITSLIKYPAGKDAVSYNIPEGVTSIGGSAFEDCSGLTSVTIPEGVTSIGRYAFYDCSGLTSVTIGEGVREIGGSAFYDCSGLTSVTIPEGVTSIGDYAFRGCSDLTSVTIPESVTWIGDDAFYDCSGLTSVTIPEGVTSIGDCAFSSCSGLTSIEVASGNENYIAVDGVLFNKDMTSLIQYPAGKDAVSYNIPEGVTSIRDYAFEDCSGLTSVTIPESVTSIGDYAFLRCSGLTSIEVASGNENYIAVDGVLFNKDITSLIKYPAGKDAVSYNIPEGVTSIGEGAFSYCSGLTSVAIPEGVTSIGMFAFYNCSDLTSITSKNIMPPPAGGYYVFEDVDKSIPLYVPAESVEAYKSALGWKEFTNILPINESVTSVIDNKADNITVRPIGNNIVVTGTDNYTVYSISGQSLGKVTSVERGIYIVVAEGKSYKVAIR